MKRKSSLTPGEFELMEILWPLGEGSVKEIWKRLDPQRRLAYTTVMTVMVKMRRKGFLTQRKKGKAYFYSPAIEREAALTAVVDDVADSYFHCSRAEFLQFLANGCKSPERTAPAFVPPDDSVSRNDRYKPIDDSLL